MKQIFKTVAVIALAAVSASCAKERLSVPSGEETLVSFTVSAPVLQTRAIADGNTVDKVACCVYNSEWTLIENGISQTVPMSGGNAKFSTRLVTGQTYHFIFWAYKSKGGEGDDKDDSAYYTFDKANKKVTVSYENASSNDESRDAFYRCITKEITGAVNETVNLYRPFAQLNFGVEKDDIKAAKAAGNIIVGKSKVTLTKLANELNLNDGTVAGEVDATFDLAACPTVMTDPENLSGELLEANDKEYGYVAMNYVLVGKDTKYTTDATLWIADADGNSIKEDGLKVPNVPIQGNYRTNVLGNLFTSAVQYTIVVVPAFTEPDYEKEIWDGQINTPSTDEAGSYLITKPSELAWVAQQNNAGTSFSGKTVLLQNDIDLCNGSWTPIGTTDNPFKGTFDGQSHTISNLNVYSTKVSDNLGLFGYAVYANFKNFTIDGAKVISEVEHGNGASCGAAVGSKGSTVTMEGITVKNAVVTSNHYVGGICNGYGSVKNCTIDGATLTALPVNIPGVNSGSAQCPDYDNGDKVGGIIGFLGEGSSTISGCKALNVTITGYRDLGGISGMGRSEAAFSDNEIGENVVINVDATYNYKDYTTKTQFCANNIVGRTSQESNNTGTATINYPEGITD